MKSENWYSASIGDTKITIKHYFYYNFLFLPNRAERTEAFRVEVHICDETPTQGQEGNPKAGTIHYANEHSFKPIMHCIFNTNIVCLFDKLQTSNKTIQLLPEINSAKVTAKKKWFFINRFVAKNISSIFAKICKNICNILILF